MNAVDVNPKMVAYYKLKVEKGVMVTKVVPESEAHRSGITAGDVLVRMDDVQMNSVRDLIKVMNKHKVGDSITVELWRGQGNMKLKTVLEKSPSMKLQTRR